MRLVAYTEPMSPGERIARERERARERLSTLAANLAAAGGLCESFRLGFDERMAAMLGLPRDEGWRPGCGKPSPSGGGERMRCKHENADHLMPGEVFHINEWNGIERGDRAVTVEQFRCLDCGLWLSLGPSRDNKPAVRDAIWAADYAQQFAEGEITREQLMAYQMHAGDLALAIIDHEGDR